MGIDIHALQLLKHNQAQHGALGKTITLGRLSVLLGPKLSKKWTGTDQGVWGEDLLVKHFTATLVDSIDNSAYEGAKIIFDYNQAIPKGLHGQYDTILDFGCSEHIFDIAQAFRNTSNLCRVGGKILHILPADNFCGHGFYQFTPEFFFSLYSESNGFIDTEIFLSDIYNYNQWFRVNAPIDGERINIRTNIETYILVITKKARENLLKAQQSDYHFIWNENRTTQIKPHKPGRLMALQEIFKFSPLLLRGIIKINNSINPEAPKKLAKNKYLTIFNPVKINF